MKEKLKLEYLVRAAQRGEEAALNEIVRRFQPLVWAAARRLAPDADDAEDLAQEANLALIQAIHNFRPAGGAPFPWYAKRQVYWAVRAAARELRRSRSREEACLDQEGEDGLALLDRLADPGPGPEEWAVAGWERKALCAAWEKLTPRQQAVVALRARGYTFERLASALGVRPSSAKGAYARAVVRLKKILAGRDQTSERR
ncbi:MAG: polymerase sporulation-specific sigma factor [Bacillota bacterium]|jgi:RNA polymerase sigma-70 factor (ECF subfamily)|nr:polymerase sporulation-specific sigma factor [Bacillota bacterium]MDK2785045.1 polymerase sporulation-specific sigma factor [Bacillota bacterium]